MLEVGARIRKSQTPRKPTVGRQHKAQTVAPIKISTAAAYGATSPIVLDTGQS